MDFYINKYLLIRLLAIPVIFFLCNNIYSQQNSGFEIRTGKVTYISSQHVYVQFDNTESINTGDTLYIVKGSNEIPSLIVKYISSRSCAGEVLPGNEIKLNDKLNAHIKISKQLETLVTTESEDTEKLKNTALVLQKQVVKTKSNKKNYYGRISLQSYSNLSNMGSQYNFQRWRYTFSFGADSISGSPFSFSSYLYFAYNTRDWGDVKTNLGKALKLYDLSLSYKLNNNNKIWFGRHLNYKISNVGSIDGVQYEHAFGNYYLGGIVGSHPDFADYGYNFKMFEYGGYVGRIDSFAASQMENTVAFFNQTNNFQTDRRYAYLQHTNNIIPGTNFFASTEIDLYKKISGTATNDITLTSLYTSLYIRPSRLVSLSLSYDARRNVVYYETYKSYIDSLFTNEMRQGYRVSLYLRPGNKMSISLNGGYRFQKTDIKPSRNFGANFYYSRIPFLDINAGVNYTRLISSYTDGSIAGIRFSKYINSLDLNLSADIRRIEYKFSYNSNKLIQNSISADASFRFPLDFYFGISYEGVFEKQNSYGRFFIDLTKRF